MTSPLYDRIYGALIGSAIGDAMGGPVEGLSFDEIARKHGRVETLLPYDDVVPSYHGPFSTEAGAYTDDTRISVLLGQAAVRSGGPPGRGDIAHACAEYYFRARLDMERGFIEEYYLKGIHGGDKEVFGGRPTNGGIMGIAALGALFPVDPEAAFDHVFRNLFLSTGSARTASALAAAMIAAAMRPGTTWERVMEDAFAACSRYKRRVEASGWRNSELYPIVAVKAEQLARTGMEMGASAASVDNLRQNLYDAVVQTFFADGSETLALASAMFAAARGDFRETVIGCVNFGRDNDSSAAVGGALAGALCGASAIPGEWIDTVERANPEPGLSLRAEQLTGLTAARLLRGRREARDRDALLFPGGIAADVPKPLPVIAEELGDDDIACRDALERALAAGADPEEPGETAARTAFHIASARGSLESMRLLLLWGADVDHRDDNRTTALHFAAWENHLDGVRLLLQRGCDADLTEGMGWTALHDAVRREYADIACEILSVSRGLEDPRGVLGRIEALDGDRCFLALLELLKSHQVRLDSVGICGQSLLHDAVQRGYRSSAAFLAANGADVNQLALELWSTRYEGTPLHKAAAFGHQDIYADLLAAGADRTILNIDGRTPPELLEEGRA